MKHLTAIATALPGIVATYSAGQSEGFFIIPVEAWAIDDAGQAVALVLRNGAATLTEASDDPDFLGLFKDNPKLHDAVHERMAEVRAQREGMGEGEKIDKNRRVLVSAARPCAGRVAPGPLSQLAQFFRGNPLGSQATRLPL
jgi:hypothetical protein